MIAIIDYKTGNIGSLYNMLKRIGAPAVIASNVSDIKKADKLILPGVGAFDAGMNNLKESGLLPAIEDKVINKKNPILGICLGMQLLGKKSEEGRLEGLSWIDAETIKFRFDGRKLKIPHMGWNNVNLKKDDPLFTGIFEPRFYFVHSYYFAPKDSENILSTTDYGAEFVSAIRSGNIFGVQFHPEKSHKYGMKLLKNFATLC